MKNNKLAFFVSLFALIGFPIIFLILSLATGQWGYLGWSLISSLTAGLTGLFASLYHIKKDGESTDLI
ncbi:hypothetical protein [Jeotgalibacillus proteolyticus]|uniref:Uncharacterized protein n=1 Tax=Jeotgalibacillus proteolyticus TaxID=2082395 RepID=A0A2S5G8Z9_9BACL|nr:hypothetical protein [Jeotgalibacillus proteolyticus]PPA69458.1 hypothetical protein C4B60_16915 [Jeotgalibacillus proteolyticus]